MLHRVLDLCQRVPDAPPVRPPNDTRLRAARDAIDAIDAPSEALRNGLQLSLAPFPALCKHCCNGYAPCADLFHRRCAHLTVEFGLLVGLRQIVGVNERVEHRHLLVEL